MAVNTASATLGSWQSFETPPLPGLKARADPRLGGHRIMATVIIADALPQRPIGCIEPNCSIQGCSSGGTACEVSWPPIQSVGSVKTTVRPTRRAASAAAQPPRPPPDDHEIGGDLPPRRRGSPEPVPTVAASRPASPEPHPSRNCRRRMIDGEPLGNDGVRS